MASNGHSSTDGALLTTIEQLRAALAAFQSASESAERYAAMVVDLKRLVGGNEADRKAARAATESAVYAERVESLAEAEIGKIAAAAHLERVEKALNVQRELLQHETALIGRETAERRAEVAKVEHDTANVLYVAADVAAAREETRRAIQGPETEVDETSDVPF